jgi:hypothetical protein
MNGLRLCKNVFKYDKKVFSVDMKELGGCFETNFKINGKNKLLCVSNDIKTKFKSLDNSEKNMLIYGILGVVGGYIWFLVHMKDEPIEGEKMFGMSIVSMMSGGLCAYVGGLLPVSPIVVMSLFVLAYGPIWIHNKRIEKKKKMVQDSTTLKSSRYKCFL